MKTKKQLLVLIVVFILAGFVALPVLARYGWPKSSEVFVTLEWAAFDKDHLALNYSVEGTFQSPVGFLPITCPISKVQVFDGTGKDVTGRVLNSCRQAEGDKYSIAQFFYTDLRETSPEHIEITVGDLPLIPVADGEIGYLPQIGVFKFEGPFTKEPAITSHPDQSANKNGLSLQISRVDFTPSTIKVDACINLPDTRDWVPNAYIAIKGKRTQVDEWFIPNFREDPGIFERSHRCYSFLSYTDIVDFRDMKPGEISFGISEVLTSVPECVDSKGFEKIKSEMENYGFRPELDETGFYCFMYEIMNAKISDAEAGALFSYINENLPEHVFGPLEIVIR